MSTVCLTGFILLSGSATNLSQTVLERLTVAFSLPCRIISVFLYFF
jgi:hypothetical protein